MEFVQCFYDNDVPLLRKNEDCTTNHYGSHLIDFCKSNNMVILNGRISIDEQSSKTTCKDKSTIDYFLSSANNLYFIKSMNILEFSNLYSDAHCPMSLCHYLLTYV